MSEAHDRAQASALPRVVPVPDPAGVRLLGSLALLNVLSYVDRQMIAALAPLLIADLGLSRARIGLLVGTSFIVVFALATLATGLLADRMARPRLLASGLSVWSAATALTGTASGFLPLALWRGLVGVGEATLSPVALSMLADRFRPGRLGAANGVFYAGIPVGFASSFALAAWVAPALGWRACFFVLGAAGLAGIALATRLDDPRTALRSSRSTPAPFPAQGRRLIADLRQLFAGQPALALLMLAGALLAYASASSQHAITWLVEERGFAYAHAAWLSALVTASAGLAGNLGIGLLTDRARRRHGAGRLLALAAIGALALAAALGFYLLPPSSRLFLPCWLLAQAWLLGWYGPLLAAILEGCPPRLRATCAGLALLVLNLCGVAIGPWITGLIGDRSSLTRGLVSSLAVGALGLGLVAIVGLRRLASQAARPASVPTPAARA